MMSFRGARRNRALRRQVNGRTTRNRRGSVANRVEAELNVVKSQVGQLRGRRPGRRARGSRRANRPPATIGNTVTQGGRRVGPTKLGQALRTGGSILGAWTGNPALGATLGAGISRIFGQGDYAVQRNSLCQEGPPAFAALNTGIRMTHREYVGDVFGSVAFRNTTYQISPTNSTLFPWLSTIATNFEEYVIRGMVFYFNTTCGSAISSTNNALGVVGMTSVYDPSDPDLASKRECEDYSGCVSGVPSASLIHPLECKPRSNVLDRLYVQIAAVTDNDDLKFYSHGKLNVFTQGMQIDNVNIGELWVSYDVEFFNPKILPLGSVGAAAGKLSWTTPANAYNSAQVLGLIDLYANAGNIAVSYTAVGGQFNIPKGTAAGYYMFVLTCTYGSSPTLIFDCDGRSPNIVEKNFFQGNSSSDFYAPNAATGNAWHSYTYVFQKTDSNAATIHLTYGAAAPTGTMQFDIVLSVVPPSLLGLTSAALMVKDDRITLDKVQGLVEKECKKYFNSLTILPPIVEESPPPLEQPSLGSEEFID